MAASPQDSDRAVTGDAASTFGRCVIYAACGAILTMRSASRAADIRSATQWVIRGCCDTRRGIAECSRLELSAGPAMMMTVKREGPFWDAVQGRAPLPPAAVTLGWEMLSVSPEQGTIEVAFTATEAFVNPAGFIQGGFLAAMLDDTMGPALAAGLEPGDFAPTIDLHVQFVRPARPGRVTGRGRVVRRGREVGFLAGELLDADGAIVAVGTATVQIRAKMLPDPAPPAVPRHATA